MADLPGVLGDEKRIGLSGMSRDGGQDPPALRYGDLQIHLVGFALEVFPSGIPQILGNLRQRVAHRLRILGILRRLGRADERLRHLAARGLARSNCRALAGHDFQRESNQRHEEQCQQRGNGLVPLHQELDLPERAGVFRLRRVAALVGLDVLRQFLHPPVAFLGKPRHRLLRHRLQGLGNLTPHRRRFARLALRPAPARGRHRRDLAALHLRQNLRHRLAIHRRPEREQRIQDAAQRVDIAPLVEEVHLPHRLLRRHVIRRAHHIPIQRPAKIPALLRRRLPLRFPLSGFRQRISQKLRQAPIHHQNLAILADHDVFRLQVPVQDFLAVREGHRVAHLAENREQVRQRKLLRRLRIPLAQGLQHRLQRAALHQLHRVVGPAFVVHADGMDRHDVRMRQPRQNLGLARKPRVHARIVADLDRHLPLELEILPHMDAAHPPARDFISQPKTSLQRSKPLAARSAKVRPARLARPHNRGIGVHRSRLSRPRHGDRFIRIEALRRRLPRERDGFIRILRLHLLVPKKHHHTGKLHRGWQLHLHALGDLVAIHRDPLHERLHLHLPPHNRQRQVPRRHRRQVDPQIRRRIPADHIIPIQQLKLMNRPSLEMQCQKSAVHQSNVPPNPHG